MFVTDRWLGGIYGSSGILGTKGGGAIAAAWAVLHHLGDDGYLRLGRGARRPPRPWPAGSAPSRSWCSAPSRRPCCWPSAPPTARSTCSPSPTRSGGGAGTSIGRVPRRRCTARSTPSTTERSHRSSAI